MGNVAPSTTASSFWMLSVMPCALDVFAWLVHHTDRGSPYASDDYRHALAAGGIVASMSRTGDCYDNAVAESFFATLKADRVDHEDFATRAIGAASIGDYVERFYNVAQRHSNWAT